MTLYDFQDVKSGKRRGFDFPFGKAPKIGTRIRRAGRSYQRVPSLATRVQCIDYACVDYALPKRQREVRNAYGKVVRKGVDASGVDRNPITARYKRVDKSGRPVMETRNDINETFANDSVKARDLIYDR